MAKGDKNKWNLTVTQGVSLDDKRNRGRAPTRWIDEILNYISPHWASNAYNRILWQNVTDQMGGVDGGSPVEEGTCKNLKKNPVYPRL